MDAIVTHVVLDRRGGKDDFEQKLGISVNQLINKLVDQDRVNSVQEESKQLRKDIDRLIGEKKQLEHDLHDADGTYLHRIKERTVLNSIRIMSV